MPEKPVRILKVYTYQALSQINYLLNTPQGKEYVMAPNFVEEIRRASDTHVSNLAANNEVSQFSS